MMKKLIAISFSILIFFSCNSKHLSNNSTGKKAGQNDVGVINGKWILQKIGDQVIDTTMYPRGAPNLQLNDDKANGYGGCNSFSGDINIEESNITFSPLISTKMACVGPNIEDQYLNILSDNTLTYELRDKQLYLTKDDNTLEFKKSD